MRRPFHVGCEHTGLGICYCLEGTPEHLRDADAADQFCQQAEDIRELWESVSTVHDAPEEAHILLPVLFKRKTKSKHKVEVEGLKAAQEEVQTAKASAERLALKAIKKANALGIPHTLMTDLNLEGSHSGTSAAEEGIEQKLQSLQSLQDQSRQEIRELDKRKVEVGLDTEKEANEIGDAMESLVHQLESIKGKLPPDRSNEVTAVEEAASAVLTRARKTRRKQRRLLRAEDITDSLIGSWLSVYWPDDNQWWNGFVQSVNPSKASATLLYETEEAEEVNLKQLVEKGEVAWLDIPTTSDPVSKRRKKHHINSP